MRKFSLQYSKQFLGGICVKVSFSSNNFVISQPIYFILTHIVA